jgi:hypothetical protein
VSEEETPFVKHAFLQQQDWDMFVQETNSHSFSNSCQRKTEPLGPISWTFETLSAGKGREEEKEEY